MKKFLMKSLLNVILLLALLFMVCSSLFIYRQFEALLNANRWVTHTYQVITANDSLLLNLLNVNRLERNYFYTGDKNALITASIDLQEIMPYFETLNQLTKDNPTQQNLVFQLRPLLQAFNATFLNEISIYQNNLRLKALTLVFSENHNSLVNKIDSLAESLNQNEKSLLMSRTERSYFVTQLTHSGFFLYCILSNFIILCVFFLVYLKEKNNLAIQRNMNRLLENRNKQLLESSQIKNDFLENMSHEFLTPLNAIIGFVELIYLEKVGPISRIQKEYLGDILSSGQQLFQLINDILDLQQLEKKTIHLHPELTHLRKIVDEVQNELNTLITKKSIHIEVRVHPAIETLIIDPNNLKKIIFNYVSNAVKFTDEEGKVSIRIFEEPKNWLRIEVEDNGIGIREEDLSKLFMPFHQIDSTFGKKYQGTGLGLALTQRVAEILGGKTGVVSTLNKGSLFFAVLPYKKK